MRRRAVMRCTVTGRALKRGAATWRAGAFRGLAAALSGVAGGAVVAIACAGCAQAPGPPAAPATPEHVFSITAAPTADSATVALWHMDEVGGLRLEDSGPLHLEAVYGRDTRPEFGRFNSARRFTISNDSFAYLAYTPDLDLGREWTIEAWINPDGFGLYEATVIAARWIGVANQQSWLLGLSGRHIMPTGATSQSPGLLTIIAGNAPVGVLLFAIQPESAGEPRTFFSTRPIETGRWTHVAVTDDGQVLRIYLDDRLDAQFANPEAIRRSDAPLAIGNLIDPSQLTEFEGSLRVNPSLATDPVYSFQGLMDEVRLSDTARNPARGASRR